MTQTPSLRATAGSAAIQASWIATALTRLAMTACTFVKENAHGV